MSPVVDGVVIPDDPLVLLTQGQGFICALPSRCQQPGIQLALALRK